MYKQIINYDGSWLKDSSDMDYFYKTEDEAREEAEMDIENYIMNWKIDGYEYERELFDIEIDEV